ncbi:MAG TPA: AAA family ATPase [Candidatus Dormibacteraeota bacterium]|nr:AAA family ATPase [Candidatus Dormibacteraeota bacterium]
MRLASVRIERFRNVVDAQTLQVEPDVTCLVGKNESGKTSVLEALHRLNPANLTSSKFDLTTEYPRWRLARDRRQGTLDRFAPITVEFVLQESDLDSAATFLPARPPDGTLCVCTKRYDNTWTVSLVCPFSDIVRAAMATAAVDEADVPPLLATDAPPATVVAAKQAAKTLRDQGDAPRAKALTSFITVLEAYGYLTGPSLDEDQVKALAKLVPRFFYFSDYDLLPGQHDLNLLAEKVASNAALDAEEQSVLSLLTYAGASPTDFLGDNYDARKAELQAAALDLTHKVFTYWTQNSDLEVDFDTELEEVGRPPNQPPTMHRILKLLLRDNRHGGVVTNFATRSAGFRWFFSFLAAFSRYQQSPDPIIVLLDEPGTSLHGEAQKDFLRFIFSELGASKQVIYATHSQYMVDPARYEKLRGVEDRSTRDNPDIGVAITPVDLTANKDTLLPVQAALGYSISQHLFIGAGRHLIVEGGSDYVYLQRFSEQLVSLRRTGLDRRLKVVPVGSAANMPAYVALIGRDMEVSVLLDGDRTGRDVQRVLAQAEAGLIQREEIVVIADVPGAVSKPDIEDLMEPGEYVDLFNLAFAQNLSEATLPPTKDRVVKRIEAIHGVFDHALPAHALTLNTEAFFQRVSATTLERFETLLRLLNATILRPPSP